MGVLKFSDFNKENISFLKEHNNFLKKYNIEFIFSKSVKLPFIYLYKVIDNLFKNNSIFLKKDEIILLTIVSIASLSRENNSNLIELKKELEKKKILKYLKYVRYTIKSLKNIFNIVLKEETIILNIEQALEHNGSIKILYSILNQIRVNTIGIKTFFNWFIVGNRIPSANDMLETVIFEYYL